MNDRLRLALASASDDEDPHGNVVDLMDAVSPDSHLVISHAAADFATDEVSAEVQAIYQGATAPVVPRTHAEVADFFKTAGLELIEPGVVGIGDWRPYFCEFFSEIIHEHHNSLAAIPGE